MTAYMELMKILSRKYCNKCPRSPKGLFFTRDFEIGFDKSSGLCNLIKNVFWISLNSLKFPLKC